MLKKIATGAVLAAVLAFATTAPAAASTQPLPETLITANVGNWPDPMTMFI